jgi:hypothetical protein
MDRAGILRLVKTALESMILCHFYFRVAALGSAGILPASEDLRSKVSRCFSR